MTCKVVTASSWNLNYLQPHDFSMFAAAVARIGTVGFIFERILSGYLCIFGIFYLPCLNKCYMQTITNIPGFHQWFCQFRSFSVILWHSCSRKRLSISRRHFERMNSPFPNTRRPVYNFNYAKTKLVILNIHDILWHKMQKKNPDMLQCACFGFPSSTSSCVYFSSKV